MLNDRDYMRRRRREDSDPETGGMRSLFILIAANVLAFILFRTPDFRLVPQIFQSGDYWTIVTALFMHDSLWHLFFNMFSLYIFGQMVAPVLGTKRFLALYFTAGIGGNLLWLLSNVTAPVGLVGASGAVMGVIMVSAMMAPDVEMYLLFIPFPVKLRTMAIVFLALEIFSQLTQPDSPVAYLAHIGGFVMGYLFAILFLKQFVRWDPLRILGGGNTRRPGNANPYNWKVSGRNNNTTSSAGTAGGPPPVTQRELDMLLDKISKQGINALSEAEMARLRQAREQMRGGK